MTEVEIDWQDAGRKFSKITTDMYHSGLHGSAYYAEALRRLWGQIGHQFITQAEASRVLEMNRAVDRANGERAQSALSHFTTEYERKMRESAHLRGRPARPLQRVHGPGAAAA
jgi:hypothetical protein